MSARPGVGNLQVLDFGCGSGTLVKLLRSKGISAFGCEMFYEGGDVSNDVDGTLLGSSIRRMEKGVIPFDAETFDIVTNNMVVEHVDDLELALSEIARVLKPGGIVLSLFPDRGAWREGHCGIPFLHRFKKGSEVRVYYAAALRTLGLGHFKGEKSPMQWSRTFCEWLDQWTHYRPIKEIESAFDRHIGRVSHVEDDWLRTRLGPRSALVRWLPSAAQCWMAGKIGCRVLTAQKPAISR